MSTARDLIKGALRLIGAIGPGETPTAEEQADALSALNDMLDSWSNERLVIHQRVRELVSLEASKAAYTLGPTGDLQTTRPTVIDQASIIFGGGAPFEYPLDIANDEQWARIPDKDRAGARPRTLHPEGSFPLETVRVHPVPSEAATLVLYSQKPLTNFATASTKVELPPGYKKALRYGLAIELAPEYGKSVDISIYNALTEAKANIKRANSKPLYLSVDSAVNSRTGHFNIYSGK